MAIIVGLSLFVLIGLLGLVLDLGHLYITKTELQNAADAAALSGAKELDGTAAGITKAVNRAILTAGQNNFDFTHPVVIGIGDISAGSCPQDSCMSPASSITTDTLAAGKTFLKVMIPSGDLRTWFMRAIPAGPQNTSTYGLAVAGKYEVDITPIAICQLPDPGTTNELGYERGISYKVSDANPIGPGTMYWLDPESSTPGSCSATNTTDTLPYVCTGKIGYTPIVGQTVNTNTGISDPQLAALDSRFDSYPPQSKCDPGTAPPDTNIKEYIYDSNPAGSPKDWMDPDPKQQSITFTDSGQPWGPVLYNRRPTFFTPTTPPVPFNYGVLWSAYRPTGATVAQWPTLYKLPPPDGQENATNYPETSPYAQTSGNFFKAPSPAHPGKPGRRVLNIVIVDCSTAGGVCRPATVMGVGKFFMQKKADKPTDKAIYVEFGGLLPTPFPPSDIKLYR
ncbi:pilus assembly protein TadG-related protein [Sulfuriferula sp. AH1]|uniref:pilus assembly protein TadG-related protein n=1 Tax=Sulfuriferula sp. AH1 TaxID=1985873 RepID=UPI0012FB1576|nr:pilus assembly protein TadG-related protein [Sulfuriferula sp. AH1]